MLRDIGISFDGSSRVLDGLNLDVAPSEIIALVGASGCGKSTLLRAIAGLQPIIQGSIQRSGEVGNGHLGDVSFVFQDATLLPWRTVLENVALPLELRAAESKRTLSKFDKNERVSNALRSVELTTDSWDRYPRQLSGGMRMRTSIARALVTNPSLLLLDEPFAALDDILRTKLNTLLLKLWQTQKQTILFVTHNIAEAVWLSHRIAVVGNKQVDRILNNSLAWPRTTELRSTLEFAQQYGRVSQALMEAGS